MVKGTGNGEGEGEAPETKPPASCNAGGRVDPSQLAGAVAGAASGAGPVVDGDTEAGGFEQAAPNNASSAIAPRPFSPVTFFMGTPSSFLKR